VRPERGESYVGTRSPEPPQALSIAAVYGDVALVAEGGRAHALIGIDTDTPVPPFVPVMMFVILLHRWRRSAELERSIRRYPARFGC
jgi:hypothetical protein